MDTETYFRFGLAHLPSFGQARLTKLLALFSAEELWSASVSELVEHRVPQKIAEKFFAERCAIDIAERLEYCTHHNIAFVAKGNDGYPALLAAIPDAPLGLFVLGKLLSAPLILGIVGTRRPSAYGLNATRNVVQELVGAGVVTVSGLALGIDACVHRETLKAGGTTIAIIASGLDAIYPRFHIRLAKEVVEHGGAIVSEFAPGTQALRHHFPIRNRIIAGLSKGVLVTEAPEKSGALLTASLGLEYNRDIFAIPGPITSPTSAGTNTLIKKGANLVQNAHDILAFYNMRAQRNAPVLSLDELTTTERDVLLCVSYEPLVADEIIKRSKLETSVVTATLTLLQMKGFVEQTDPLHFVRRI